MILSATSNHHLTESRGWNSHRQSEIWLQRETIVFTRILESQTDIIRFLIGNLFNHSNDVVPAILMVIKQIQRKIPHC